MSKIPAIIQISDDQEVLLLEGFSEMPVLEQNIEEICFGGGMENRRMYGIPRSKWTDIEIDFLDCLTERQSNWLVNWFHSFYNGPACIKKDISITHAVNGYNFTMNGCVPLSYEQKIPEDFKYNNVIKNNNPLTRKVLFEKKGNEIMNISMSVSFSMDRVEYTDAD